MNILKFVRALKESWEEAKIASNADKLKDLKVEKEIDSERDALTRSKVVATLAMAEQTKALAGKRRAKK